MSKSQVAKIADRLIHNDSGSSPHQSGRADCEHPNIRHIEKQPRDARVGDQYRLARQAC